MSQNVDNEMATLYNKMGMYNFDKQFNVTISIIDDDDNMTPPELHIDNRNTKEIISSEIMDKETGQEQQDEIISVFSENALESAELNNNINNEKTFCNNLCLTSMSPEVHNNTTELQNESQTTVNSSNTTCVISHPPTENSSTTSPRPLDINVQFDKSHDILYVLSRSMIRIIRNYHYFRTIYYNELRECNELSRKCNEQYIYTKEPYVRTCVDIIKGLILPLRNKFNVQDFLNKTCNIADPSERNLITYTNLERLYNELRAICYKEVYCDNLTNPKRSLIHNDINTNITNNGNNLVSQPNVQNCQSRNDPETVYNAHNSIFQENSQNNWHFGNKTQNMNNMSDIRRCNNVTLPINNMCNPVLQRNTQNNSHSKIMTETMNLHSSCLTQIAGNNNYIPTFQQQYIIRNDNHNNITKTIDKGSNSLLQPNSRNERLMTNVTKFVNNAPNAMQEIIRNTNNNYYQGTQIIRNKPITDANYQNNLQFNNETQSRDNITNSLFHQNIQNDQNCNKEPRNSSKYSSTCVYQYKNPNWEVRLDVDTNILNEVINKNQVNNDLPVGDPNSVRKQFPDGNVNESGQNINFFNVVNNQIPYQDVSQDVQESSRSNSRDSGFMSPCNNEMNVACHSEEEQNMGYITNVTSLNPKAIRTPKGACHICGKISNNKCAGCYKHHYCSHLCQKIHWSRHQYECRNTT